MCFSHALLNVLYMKDRGFDAGLIIEGTATHQIKELTDSRKPFANLYQKVKSEGLIDGVCRACSAKTGSRQGAEEGLRLLDDMSGLPRVAG